MVGWPRRSRLPILRLGILQSSSFRGRDSDASRPKAAKLLVSTLQASEIHKNIWIQWKSIISSNKTHEIHQTSLKTNTISWTNMPTITNPIQINKLHIIPPLIPWRGQRQRWQPGDSHNYVGILRMTAVGYCRMIVGWHMLRFGLNLHSLQCLELGWS